ncbi:MAG: helix-turn-helix domain-containing protein [Chloroflexota bacterium]|nr:helix-turn-helix domain-containing protein [Chloroflexota bacterium]
MSASIHKFRSTRARLNAEQAEETRQFLLDFGEEHDLPDDALGRIIAAIDAETATERKWTFVMIGPRENRAVARWLRQNSRRPLAALGLWLELFPALRYDTGEIMLSRDELAERVGIAPDNVSRIMTELEGIGAVSRRRVGRGVRYYMNPTLGTHLTGKARDDAQAAAHQLELELIDGGVS